MTDFIRMNGVPARVRDDIRLYVDKAIASRRSRSVRQKTAFYPSVDLKCERQTLYRWFDVPEDEGSEKTPELERLLTAGNLLHGEVQTLLARAGLFYGQEVHSGSRDDGTSFRPDFYLKVRFKEQAKVLGWPKGTVVVVEIKTVTQGQYERWIPRFDDFRQLNYYMGRDRIKKGLLVYLAQGWLARYSQRQSDMVYYEVRFDKALFDDTVARFRSMKKFARLRTVPRRLVGFPKLWTCQTCPFLITCRNASSSSYKWEGP